MFLHLVFLQGLIARITGEDHHAEKKKKEKNIMKILINHDTIATKEIKSAICRHNDRTQSCRQGFRGSERYVLKLSNVLLLVPVLSCSSQCSPGKERQQLLKDYMLYNSELFLAWSITIFVVLNVKVLGVSRFDQSFWNLQVSKIRLQGLQGSALCLEEEGKSLLFSSILK